MSSLLTTKYEGRVYMEKAMVRAQEGGTDTTKPIHQSTDRPRGAQEGGREGHYPNTDSPINRQTNGSTDQHFLFLLVPSSQTCALIPNAFPSCRHVDLIVTGKKGRKVLAPPGNLSYS